MTKVVLDVSMSLDGFTAGPNVSADKPMGVGGERLHRWREGKDPNGGVDLGVARDLDQSVGATIIGRRTFDLGLRPWGGTPWPGIPSFVVTHRISEDLVADNGGTFAFDGLVSAARRAKDAAGDKDVVVLGAHVARGLFRAGLLDEVHVHVVPLLMGDGTRLFFSEHADLIPAGEPATGSVVHLRYRLKEADPREPAAVPDPAAAANIHTVIQPPRMTSNEKRTATMGPLA